MTTADLQLRKTRNLAAQLNDAEWLASLPGGDEHKKFLVNCNSCHALQRIVMSTHDAGEFLQVFERMAGYYPGSTPLHPQRLVGTARRSLIDPARAREDAEYLASVNLSEGPSWPYS